MTGIKEATIELYLKNAIDTAGGECFKVKSSGEKGVPDRIVVINGLTVFVEVKSPTGKVSPQQDRVFRRIMAAGGMVFVVSEKDHVDNLMVFLLQDVDEAPSLILPEYLQ